MEEDLDPNEMVALTTAIDANSPLMGNDTAMVPRWLKLRFVNLQHDNYRMRQSLSEIQRICEEQ
jgi:hypothetical protein